MLLEDRSQVVQSIHMGQAVSRLSKRGAIISRLLSLGYLNVIVLKSEHGNDNDQRHYLVLINKT